MSDEDWVTIDGFPVYEISSQGRVYNTRLGIYMKTSRTQFGHSKVSIWDENGIRHTLSIRGLVARAFVSPPNHLCDYPMLKDGDLFNVSAENVVWRPRHFSWRYMHQFKVLQPLHYMNLRVVNVVTGVEYDSIMKAGIAEGLLFQDIWESTHKGSQCFPLGSVFEVIG